MLSGADSAYAQATRTWVSGVGDDVNPCSRTAPCKTFAGAISKTAAGGEINALDPGGFGAVTITKSITIDGTTGAGFGSILASGTNGVVINGAGIQVNLRNLSIDGGGTGLNGILISQAQEVYVENTVIFNFKGGGAGRGIFDQRNTAGSLLFVTDTTVQDNSSNGIAMNPASGTSTTKALLSGVELLGNGAAGLVVQSDMRATITDSVSAGNVDGILVNNTAQVNVERTALTNNTTGIKTLTAGATARVSESMITNNTVGFDFTLGGTIATFLNNRVAGNGSGENFNGTINLK